MGRPGDPRLALSTTYAHLPTYNMVFLLVF